MPGAVNVVASIGRWLDRLSTAELLGRSSLLAVILGSLISRMLLEESEASELLFPGDGSSGRVEVGAWTVLLASRWVEGISDGVSS